MKSSNHVRDGTTVWTEVVTRVFYDEFGKPAGIIGVSRDISKRRKAEEALRENEKIFHLFSENSPDVQFLWDLKNDKPTYVSPSITRMTGFTVEEVFHSRRDLMMTPQSLAYYLPLQTERNRLFLKDPKKEREYIDELQYYRKDGSTYYAEIYKHYMLDKHGNPLLIGILRDITERKKAEEALRDSEEHFRNLFEHAPIGIFHSIPDGKLLAVNPALVSMLGYSSPEELISATSDMTTQIYVDPKERPKIMNVLLSTDGWVHYDG